MSRIIARQAAAHSSASCCLRSRATSAHKRCAAAGHERREAQQLALASASAHARVAATLGRTVRNDCASCTATQRHLRAAMRGQRAWLLRAHARAARGRGAAACGGGVAVKLPIRSTTRNETPSSACTRRTDEICTNGFSSSNWPETILRRRRAAAAAHVGAGAGGVYGEEIGPIDSVSKTELYDLLDLDRPNGPGSNDEHSVHLHHRDFIVTPIADQIGPIDSVSKTELYDLKNHFSEPQCKMTVLPLNSGKPRTCVTLNGSGIQLAVGPQPLWLRNHNSGPAQRIMVKRLETLPHDPLGITDSACKNQLVVVSVQYGPFNPYIPIRSTTIGKSRVAIDPIAMHTSWRSNSDIASVTSIGYPRMSASDESSTTMHRLLHASGSHPIPTPYDPKTNQYNQDLGLIHSTNGNHLESPKEGSSIDHQVTIYLHAQNITMFPTNETWYFASQILVSNSGGLIIILTAQSTRNMFRIHSDY
ncbi:protein EXPORTIN 1A [Dorcoceras hygrometricum]|uniref:Protein EXPORTIN 1A n=1 Tax=Dorcoceras hygrometricum TaxID=472368 RepID=A0A2Z7BER7_9LAMI|nr:protein EXPORTIN 1A [Dorcoceras hygrometricum]